MPTWKKKVGDITGGGHARQKQHSTKPGLKPGFKPGLNTVKPSNQGYLQLPQDVPEPLTEQGELLPQRQVLRVTLSEIKWDQELSKVVGIFGELENLSRWGY